MILDRLERAERYFKIHPRFEMAFEVLRSGGHLKGKHQVLGDSLLLIYDELSGKERSYAKLEAHRKYIDIQYVIGGDEEMGYRPLEKCISVREEYNQEKDILFFDDEPLVWVPVPVGYFMIFFPEDAHAPLIGKGMIKKAIMKVMC